MKWIIAVAIFFSGATFSSCQSDSKNVAINQIEQGSISVEDFERKLNATGNAQLIDVRTSEEFLSGHLASAINVDWNNKGFDVNVGRLDKSKPTFVYCLSASRSANAVRAMKAIGFQEIYEMKGGLIRWYNAGKPVVTKDKAEVSKGMTLDEYTTQLKTEKIVLVDFNAPWCAPCRKMAPMLERIAVQQQDKLKLIKINIDDNKDLATALGIEILPTLILYRNGKEVWKQVGLTEEREILEAIEHN